MPNTTKKDEGRDIEVGNRLIAKFMDNDVMVTIESNGRNYNSTVSARQIDNYKDVFIPYDKKWDWLMPVVQKTQELCNAVQYAFPADDKDKDLNDPTGWRAWSYRYPKLTTDINKTWQSVVDFLKWYNTIY